MTVAIAAQFAELGVHVPAAAIEEDDVVDVWNIHAEAVRLFMACAGQWRVAALSTFSRARLVRTGLDYTAVEATMRMLRIRDKRGVVFAQIRQLEQFAIEAWAEVS